MIKSASDIRSADPREGLEVGPPDRAADRVRRRLQITIQVLTRMLAQLSEWIASTFHGTVALTGPVVFIHDDCPQCGERTLCEISAFHGHYRCLECDRPIRERKEQVGASPRVEGKDLVAA